MMWRNQPPLLFVIATLVVFAASGRALPQFGYEEVHGYEKDPVLHQFDVLDQYERIKQDITQPGQQPVTNEDKDAAKQPAVPQAEDKEKPLNPVEAEIEAKEKPATEQDKPQGEAKAKYDYEPEFDERKDTYGHYKEQADLEFNIKDTISNLAFQKLPPVYQQLDKLAKWNGDEKTDDDDKDDEEKDDYEEVRGTSDAFEERREDRTDLGNHGNRRGNNYGGRSDRDEEGYGGYEYGGYGGNDRRGNKKDRRDEGYDNNGDYSTQFKYELLANAAKRYA